MLDNVDCTLPQKSLHRTANQLLMRLPMSDFELVSPHLCRVDLSFHQVLQPLGEPFEEIHFIEAGVISITTEIDKGAFVEVAMTGREGFTGVALLVRPDARSMFRLIVQAPGSALRMGLREFREVLACSKALHAECMLHLHSVLVQSSQGVACNARHTLPMRLARWLLTMGDRVGFDEFPLKQAFLASLLGVRRAGVSVVAGDLHARGLVRQSRGRVRIVDRPGLEREACSCYRKILDREREIMGGQGRSSADRHGEDAGE